MNETASKMLFDKDVFKIDGRLLSVRGWKLYSKEFPVLDVGFQAGGRTEFRVRLIANNWNAEPPAIELLDKDGNYLTGPKIPQNSGNVFHTDNHHLTGRPFICMPGAREYHTHQSHVADSWDNYRHQSGYDLGGIMTQLWWVWQKCNP
jgi:hypothetical protein